LEWQQAGLPPLKVAVNVSAIQFAQANFIANIAHILTESAFDPALLELELTETMLMGDHDAVERQLTQLSNLRLSLAIDDFGKGYSSLGYLHRLPISVLKIDRSFVEPLGTAHEETRTQAILGAIVTLAHHLQMQVIAEGVETAEQHRILMEMECDFFQGYYFSRPLPAAELTALLTPDV
jgi:EAL domain-containing protein (putative c-di-GMP-specific phosphodiesterase class I)